MQARTEPPDRPHDRRASVDRIAVEPSRRRGVVDWRGHHVGVATEGHAPVSLHDDSAGRGAWSNAEECAFDASTGVTDSYEPQQLTRYDLIPDARVPLLVHDRDQESAVGLGSAARRIEQPVGAPTRAGHGDGWSEREIVSHRAPPQLDVVLPHSLGQKECPRPGRIEVEPSRHLPHPERRIVFPRMEYVRDGKHAFTDGPALLEDPDAHRVLAQRHCVGEITRRSDADDARPPLQIVPGETSLARRSTAPGDQGARSSAQGGQDIIAVQHHLLLGRIGGHRTGQPPHRPAREPAHERPVVASSEHRGKRRPTTDEQHVELPSSVAREKEGRGGADGLASPIHEEAREENGAETRRYQKTTRAERALRHPREHRVVAYATEPRRAHLGGRGA
jgi:hypothetical protein